MDDNNFLMKQSQWWIKNKRGEYLLKTLKLMTVNHVLVILLT